MRRYYESIQLETKPNGVPHRLFWRRRLFTVVSIEEQWRYSGKWWLDGVGRQRNYYRVTARSGSQLVTMELYSQYRQWTLCGLCD